MTATSPRIIDWPASLAPRTQDWSLFVPQVGGVNAAGYGFGTVWGMPRWRVTVETPQAHASDLPQWQAFVLRLRAGVNLVRIADLRESGRGRVLNQPRRVLNMLRWTQQWARWDRVGAAPVTVAGSVATSRQPNTHYQPLAQALEAGVRYVFVVEVQASSAQAQVALLAALGEQLHPTGVIFNAATGAAEATLGNVARSGAVARAGGGWRCWWELRPQVDVQALVQVQTLLPAHGLVQVQASQPMVSVVVGAVPPGFVATTGTPAWGDFSPAVDGPDQTGDQLATKGWPAGAQLRAGYWLGIGNDMHMLVDSAVADDDGKAMLWVEPPLRKSPVDNAAIKTQGISGVFRLSAPVAGVREELHAMEGITMTFEEVPQ